MKKKIVTICVVSFVLFIIGIFMIIRFVPGKILEKIVGTDSELSQIACIYPVKMQGRSMEPIFSEGDIINFNKCIDDRENIMLDTIIVYKDKSIMRVARIREKLDGESGKHYKVSPDGRSEDYADVFPDDIIAKYGN